MPKIILIIVATIISCIMLLGNSKVRLFSLIWAQVKVFKNAKTNKFSLWDIICFLILPIGLALVIALGFNCIIDENLAGVLTTVFAFVFTVLFGFASILVGKMNSNNELEKKVVGETFVSIMTSNILSLIAAILSIGITFSNNIIASLILSIFIYSLSFMIIMLLLMISKRTFIIYCNNKK